MCYARNKKWQTTHNERSRTTKSNSLLNQVVIRTLEEKETYKYLGILEADTIKQQEMKEIFKKSISEEPENDSRKNSKSGTLSKG